MARVVGPTLCVTWQDVVSLAETVARQAQQERFDVFLGISRGGLIPLALLAERLKVCNVVTASIYSYDERCLPLPKPIVVQLPPKEVFRGQRVLIIDDIWDKGRTIKMLKAYVRSAGGTSKAATLYLKRPEHTNALRTRNGDHPDFYAEVTHLWVRYPWEKEV